MDWTDLEQERDKRLAPACMVINILAAQSVGNFFKGVAMIIFSRRTLLLLASWLI
jgi:hypothetical protein